MNDKEFIEKWKNRNVEVMLLSAPDKHYTRAIVTIGDTVHIFTCEECNELHEINTRINILLRESKLKRICNER